ncbi:MAG: methyltransferase [Chloroherpetonaceae bacterium]|nr:methyltransferase [Chloroherpetonaceae bacterium]
MRLTTAYWESAVLATACALDLFDVLDGGARTAEEVAARAHTDLRATRMLLEACTALGLLTRHMDSGAPRYASAPAAARYLARSSPTCMRDAVQWGLAQYPIWGQLTQSVRSGQPAVSPESHLGGDPEQTRAFVRAMHQRALSMARGIVPFLPMDGVQELLDVGGGSGALACLLAQQYPSLRATVLDLPSVVAIADTWIAQMGLSDRVRTRAGDATQEDYGVNAFDAVLFFGVLHQMAPDTIPLMLERAYRALRPGGQVLICDLMTDDTGHRTPFVALFALQMLLTSHRGHVFSVSDGARWLEQAGFEHVAGQALPPPLPYTILRAQRRFT